MSNTFANDSNKDQKGYIVISQPKIYSDQKLDIYSIKKIPFNNIDADFQSQHQKIAMYNSNNLVELYDDIYNEFCKYTTHRKDIGNEYFESNIDILQKLLNKIIISHCENEKYKIATTTLKKFNLFDRMVEEFDEKSSIKIIVEDLNKIGFRICDVEYFINNYNKIKYTKKNIHGYCELVFKFGIYSIDKNFIDHIVDRYVFSKKMLLCKLKHYEQVIENIQKKLSSKNDCDDDDISYILNHISPSEITSLNASNGNNITNASIKHLINLKSLDASHNECISDLSIRKLINLTSLNVSCNHKITDESAQLLINLQSLDARNNLKITDHSISRLVNLKSLKLSHSSDVTDDGIKSLTNLTSLDVSKNITDDGIKSLTNLTSLNTNLSKNITDDGIKSLTNLISLDANFYMTNASIKLLTKLKHLSACDNGKISDEGINNLINLTYLDASENSYITNEGIKGLINLTTLDASYNPNITSEGIKHLINLKNITLDGYDVFSNSD